MPGSGISKCISLPTPFLFHLHKSVSFFTEPILGERTGTEQAMSYSELKEEIHAARGKTAEKCVSVADDSSSLLMPLLKHQGVRASQRSCTSQR